MFFFCFCGCVVWGEVANISGNIHFSVWGQERTTVDSIWDVRSVVNIQGLGNILYDHIDR